MRGFFVYDGPQPEPTVARVRCLRAMLPGVMGYNSGSGQMQCVQRLREHGLVGHGRSEITMAGVAWLAYQEKHWSGWKKAVAT